MKTLHLLLFLSIATLFFPSPVLSDTQATDAPQMKFHYRNADFTPSGKLRLIIYSKDLTVYEELDTVSATGNQVIISSGGKTSFFTIYDTLHVDNFYAKKFGDIHLQAIVDSYLNPGRQQYWYDISYSDTSYCWHKFSYSMLQTTIDGMVTYYPNQTKDDAINETVLSDTKIVSKINYKLIFHIWCILAAFVLIVVRVYKIDLKHYPSKAEQTHFYWPNLLLKRLVALVCILIIIASIFSFFWMGENELPVLIILVVLLSALYGLIIFLRKKRKKKK